jgi:hypothetical protein
MDPSAPYLTSLMGFVEPYLGDLLTDLFARLAASYTPPAGVAKGDMTANAMSHLVQIMATQVKDPQLLKKLSDWKALPKKTENEKKRKTEAKVQLRAELFGSCSEKVMEKAGWDQLAHIRCPDVLRPQMQKLMAKTVLPDQLFRIAVEMLVVPPLEPVEERRLKSMGGVEEVNILADGLAEKFTPLIMSAVRENAGLLGAKINDNMAKHTLNVAEEAWLGKEIDSLLAKENKEMLPTWQFTEFLLSKTFRQGLAKLALSYDGPQQADFTANIALYLVKRLKELPFQQAEMIRIYAEQTAPLKELDKKIEALRKQAVSKYPHIGPIEDELKGLLAERVRLKAELEEKFEISKTRQKLFKAYEPVVLAVLRDMGYPDAASLPVPRFLKETLWKNLVTNLLPDLCLTASEKILGGLDTLVPDPKEMEMYEQKLKDRHEKRLPAGTKLPPGAKAPLVDRIHKLTDHLVKETESHLALHGTEKAGQIIDAVIPQLYSGEKGRLAAGQIQGRREELAKWLGQESPQMLEEAQKQMGKTVHQMMAAPILKGTSTFLENIERIERERPELLFDFVFQAVPLCSDHLAIATAIAKKEKKEFIHDVDPLIMLRGFQEAGRLHPAMPGWREMKAISEQDRYIQQLEAAVKQGGQKGWHLQVDRLKPGSRELEMGPDYFLQEAKTNRDVMQKEIEAKMREHFYNDFSLYLLKMAGMNKADDLPGGEEFWNLMGMTKAEGWEQFRQIVPMILMEGMRTAFTPEKINGYMANLLVAVNDNLRVRRRKGDMDQLPQRGPLDPKIQAMEDRCRALVQEMKKVLPGTIVEGLTEFPLLDEVPGRVLSEVLQDALRQYPLSRVIEEGMVAGIDKLPEKLPKTFAEAESARLRQTEEDKKKIENVRKEAEKTFPLFVDRLERNLISWWGARQGRWDRWVVRHLGTHAGKAKSFLDRLFHFTFITLLMAPIYKASRWLLSFGIDWYSKRVGSYAELGRASLADTSINANLAFQLGDMFQLTYR